MMQDIVLKVEPQDTEYIKPQILENIASDAMAESENPKMRCGEIFVTNNARKWTFTCTYCNKTTRDVGEFICHIQFKHMNAQYTEEDDRDKTDELQPMGSVYTEKSFNNQEQNIINNTNDLSQIFASTTPAIGLVSPSANSNTSIFAVSGQYKVEEDIEDNPDELQPMEASYSEDSFNKEDQNMMFEIINEPCCTSTFETDTNLGGSAYTESDKEFNAAASQQNTKFPIDTTTNIRNTGKRKLDTIDELKETVRTQNEAIMGALATQRLLMDKLIRQGKVECEVKNAFPIRNIEDLNALNDEISHENRQAYVKTMRALLKGKLSKTLTSILSNEVIVEINIDGIHGKKRLKDFVNVFDSLMDAVRTHFTDPDKELRNAIKVIKKRHFHNVCIQKQTKK